MGFIIILVLTTLAIAGSAAAFSVYGLAQIFAGAFVPVVVMGASLEAGKLVAASYIYRYWKDISVLMRAYLLSAILILMVITSAGIFGFLSAAYQTDTLPLKEMESRIELYGERKIEIKNLKAERIAQRSNLDAQIAAIPGTHSTNRRKMRESQKDERAQIAADLKQFGAELLQVSNDRSEIQNNKIQQEAHIGPIIYIAKVFEKDTDDATMWMIILIIFAFDPLAVALTIATNNVMMHRTGVDKRVEKRVRILEDNFEDVEPMPTDDDPLDEPEFELEMGEPDNLVTEIQTLFPNYKESDAEEALMRLLAKQKDGTLTIHEKNQYEKIMNMLNAARAAKHKT